MISNKPHRAVGSLWALLSGTLVHPSLLPLPVAAARCAAVVSLYPAHLETVDCLHLTDQGNNTITFMILSLFHQFKLHLVMASQCKSDHTTPFKTLLSCLIVLEMDTLKMMTEAHRGYHSNFRGSSC